MKKTEAAILQAAYALIAMRRRARRENPAAFGFAGEDECPPGSDRRAWEALRKLERAVESDRDRIRVARARGRK